MSTNNIIYLAIRLFPAPLQAARFAGMVALLLVLAAQLSAQQAGVTVLYPNGGETVIAGTTVQVQWSSSGVEGEVEVEYSIDAGAKWRKINRVDVSTESLAWDVRNNPSAQALVRVTTKDGSYSDQSNNVFEILEDPLDRTLMKAPNGGEVWEEAETHAISWQVPVDAVDALIELSTDGGLTWMEIVKAPVAISRYQWIVPHLSDNEITNAVMKVSVAEAPDHYDISDAPFVIRPNAIQQQPSITVVYPNGHEVFAVDSVLDVA